MKIELGSLEVEVVRKDIKNMHLGVYPPQGRVRLSVPVDTSEEKIRLFVLSKLPWVKKQQRKFQEQNREAPREYISGESHYYQGHRYRLKVIEHTGNNRVVLRNKSIMELYVKPGSTIESRRKVLQEWYRRQLKAQIPELLTKWEDIMGVKANDWGVKRMRTKWGTCNIEARRIWLNLELAKKPPICLEYIIVHELIHFFERNHNARFVALMDKYMPNWRQHRDTLNALPVSHVDWGY